LIDDFAAGAGFIAATIAVCGFIGQAVPALRRRDDETVRAATVLGGLVGLLFGSVITAVAGIKW